MLWDITPLSYWQGKSKKKAYEVIFEVLDAVLDLPNIACVESALHGLGHMQLDNPRQVAALIERFLERRRDLPRELEEYARGAMKGMVQQQVRVRVMVRVER